MNLSDIYGRVAPFGKIDKLQIIGNIGLSYVFDTVNYDTFSFTCDQSTLDISGTNIILGRTVTLVITGGDSCVITWPTGTVWPEGEPPALTSGIDRVVLQRASDTAIHASLAGVSYA